MALTPGTRLGVYEITAQIGEGGMGEVYRATDTNLKRSVAMKVLPAAVAADADRLARFQREAEVLAALNHPNIAAIYGLERSGAMTALVMELVEGEDLSQHIARGRMPLDEALPIAKQIADALEAAHEQGIIHRDLKPGNIKVRSDGTVKVLDFGLAKAMDATGASNLNATRSPTLAQHATMAGVILGTVAYMSPEQARGRTVDKRADIWAFGVVLFEMLAGRHPFAGDHDVVTTVASVIKGQPAYAALPTDTPDAIQRLLRRSLEKDPRHRLADIGDARLEIADASEAKPGADGSLAAARSAPPTRERVWQLTAAALTVIAALALWWGWSRGVRSGAAGPVLASRLDVNLGADIPIESTGPAVILSPDATRLVFLSMDSAGKTRLFTKRLDQPQATELPGTDGAHGAFFSPDGQWVGFFAAGKLKKIRIDDNQLTTLCEAPAGRGASWSDDGTFIVADLNTTGALSRIPAEGGSPAAVTALRNDERSHRWPQMLPGGKAVLFIVNSSPANFSEDSFAVVSLGESRSGVPAHKIILKHAGLYPRYLSSGHLVFVKKGILYAVPFDLGQLMVHGVPAAVVENVSSDQRFGFSQFDISTSGTLVYHRGGALGLTSLQWMDSAGNTDAILAEPAMYTLPKVSPDGGRIALSLGEEPNTDIWIYDWRTGTRTRLTEGPGMKSYPVWSSDGRFLVFAAQGGIFWVPADAAEKPKLLIRSQGTTALPSSFSKDGTRLAFVEQINNTWPIKTVAMKGDSSAPQAGNPELFVDLPAGSSWPAFSPDGRWLAYSSSESGVYEVYVRTFPDKGTKRLISSGGGVMPMWSDNAKELFYRTEDQRIMVVPYAVNGDSFVAEGPRLWSARRLANTGTTANLDLAPDGRRFAALMPAEAAEPREMRGHFTLVPNFFEELRRLVPSAAR